MSASPSHPERLSLQLPGTKSERQIKYENIYGWIIVGVAFFCICIPDGILVAFGGFVHPLAREFQVHPTTLTLAASLMNGVKSLFGLVVSSLMDKYGYRIIGISGGLVLALSLLVCAFSTHVAMFVISFGIFGGIGGAMVFLPPIILIGKYFKRRRALATTIARVGSPLGGFILVPICNLMQEYFGWQTSFLVLVGISLICPVLCGLLKMAHHLEPVPNLARRKSFYIGVPLKGMSPNSSRKGSPNARSSGKTFWRDEELEDEPSAMGNTELFEERAPLRVQVEVGPTSDPMGSVPKEQPVSSPPLLGPVHKKPPKIVVVPPFEETMKDPKDHETTGLKRVNFSEVSDLHSGLNQILFAHLQMLAKRHPSRWERFCETFSLDLFRNPVFTCFVLANALGNAAGFIPFVYLQGYMSDIGISNTLCGVVIALIQLANALGRLPLGWIADWPQVNPLMITGLLWLLSGVVVIIFACLGRVELFIFFGILYGLGNTALSIQSVILLEILEMNRLPDAFGLLLFLEGVSKTLIPPLSGYVSSYLNSPRLVFFLSAIGFLLSAIGCFLSYFFSKQRSQECLAPTYDV